MEGYIFFVVILFLSTVTVLSVSVFRRIETCEREDSKACDEYDIPSNFDHYCKQAWMKTYCCNVCVESRDNFVPIVEVGEDDLKFYCDPPCQNNGRCVGPSFCKCPNGFSGDHCEKVGSKKKRKYSNQGRQSYSANSFAGSDNFIRDDYADYVSNYYRNYYRNQRRHNEVQYDNWYNWFGH